MVPVVLEYQFRLPGAFEILYVVRHVELPSAPTAGLVIQTENDEVALEVDQVTWSIPGQRYHCSCHLEPMSFSSVADVLRFLGREWRLQGVDDVVHPDFAPASYYADKHF